MTAVAFFAATIAGVPSAMMTSTFSRTSSSAISAVALVASLGPAILDRDGAILHMTELAQPLHERGGQFAPGGRGRPEDADGRQLARLLRSRRERPRGRRAAEQRDESRGASLDHLVGPTLSGSGIVRPSALAVRRLSTSSIFTACWTGRSPGFLSLKHAAHVDAFLWRCASSRLPP